MTAHRGCSAAVSALALAIAGTCSLLLNAQGSSLVRSTPYAEDALRLCDGWNAGGSLQVITGSRVQWIRPSELGALEGPPPLMAMLARSPSVLITANGPWVAMAGIGDSVAAKVNCASGRRSTIDLRYPSDLLAISPEGDVAAHARRGVTTIQLDDRDAAAIPASDVPDDGEAPIRLFWGGSRLNVFSRGRLTVVEPRKEGYFRAEVPIDQESEPAAAAFWYNGLTYVERSVGCFDIYLGNALRPRLKSALCRPESPAPDEILFADDSSIRVRTPSSGIRWAGPRPSAITGRISGTGADIARGLATLTRAEQIPVVPMVAAPRDAERAGPFRASDQLPFWTTELWSSRQRLPTEYQAALTDMVAKGWVQPRANGSWTEARGLAIGWRAAVDFVRPAGRSLHDIAMQQRSQVDYTAAEIETILKNNRSLSTTLEGYLLTSGWTPIGAVLGAGNTPPVAFASRRIVAESPRTFGRCDAAPTAAAEDVAGIIRRGLPVAGVPELALATVLGGVSSLHVAAENAFVTTCDVFGDRTPRRILLLRGAKLRPRPLPALGPQTVVPSADGELSFRVNDEAEWPIRIEGDVVVAVAGLPASAGGRTPVSAWLDRLFTRDTTPQLLFPVTVLEVAAVATPSATIRTPSGPNLSFVSGERARSAPRASPCDAIATAEALRHQYDELIGLVPGQARNVDRHMIAIAENAVDRWHDIFKKASNAYVWVAPNQNHELQRVTAPMVERQRADKDRAHGTAVASIIVSQQLLKGELAEATLVWLDLEDVPNFNVLNTLSAGFSVVNVSQKLLGDAWVTLDEEMGNKDAYRKGLLVVAAAKNRNADPNGPPIDWHTAKVNVLGVGVAMPNRLLPTALTYSPDYLDLLAPGETVPAVRHDSSLACESGSSYAAAYVSAVAALVADAAADAPVAANLRARLIATADWLDSYSGFVRGGLINADRALDGVGENILTTERLDGTELKMKVTIKGTLAQVARVKVSGFIKSGTRTRSDEDTVLWRRILRLTRTTKGQAADGSDSRFRITFVRDNGKLAVWESAKLMPADNSPAPAAMPELECLTRTSPAESVPCGAVSILRIKDYVAALSTFDITAFEN